MIQALIGPRAGKLRWIRWLAEKPGIESVSN